MVKPGVRKYRKYYHIDVSGFAASDNELFLSRILKVIDDARFNERGGYIEIPIAPPELIDKAKYIMRDIYGIDSDGRLKMLTDSVTSENISSINSAEPDKQAGVFHMIDIGPTVLTDEYFREEVIRQADYCRKYLGINTYINKQKEIPVQNGIITIDKIQYRIIKPPRIKSIDNRYIYEAAVERITTSSEYNPGNNPGDLFRLEWSISEGEFPFCPFEKIKWTHPDKIDYINIG